MQQFNKNIEERALAKGNRWKTRTPFILSCAFLYYGLAAPLLFTSKLTADIMVPLWANQLLKTLIGVQWFGFGIAALGDLTKTYVKQSEKEEGFLVTSGIFSILRHPNYTGEIIGWTANNLCGLIASCFVLRNNNITPLLLSNLATMTLGWIGILFVLLQASGSLEVRQKKDYGSDPKYKKWIKSSWGGWKLPAKKEPSEEPHIEVNDEPEDFGSGI
jgi:steroid 5-alpha reductase family enzyme